MHASRRRCARGTWVACLLATALAGGCASEPTRREPPPSGATFQSRRGDFTCIVPPLIRPGARLVETYEGDNTFVSMSDDMGTLLRIESSPVEPEDRSRFEAMPRDASLNAMFDRVLMPVEFLRASPQASVLHREMVQTPAGRALFAVVRIPGGSTTAEVDAAGVAHRTDSVRGVLTFVVHWRVYDVSNQEPPAYPSFQGVVLHRSPTIDERADRLLHALDKVVGGMTFN